MSPLRVCFFAPVDDVEKLRRIGFYAQDLQALERIGYDIVVATKWREIPWGADVYFVWWWTWAFLPLIKAKLLRRRVVITGTFNLRWGSGDYFHRPYWQRLLLRAALRAADCNIFVSMHEMIPMSSSGWATNPIYGPHCVDTDLYQPGTSPRSHDVILSIGWLRMENAVRKGFPELISALPAVLDERPGTRLVLVGEQDSGYPYLRDHAEKLGVAHAIEWSGAVDEQEKIALLQGCSLYVQPSKYEGFGLAILEAMSCGAAVVTCAVGAVPEVGGDAVIYVDDAPGSLANQIIQLLRSPSEARELGVRARARAVSEFPLRRRANDIQLALDLALSHRRAKVRLHGTGR